LGADTNDGVEKERGRRSKSERYTTTPARVYENIKKRAEIKAAASTIISVGKAVEIRRFGFGEGNISSMVFQR
jgi:hypothetical protein